MFALQGLGNDLIDTCAGYFEDPFPKEGMKMILLLNYRSIIR